MKWLIVPLVLALVPVVAGCQVTSTSEFVRAVLCEPAEPEVPVEPGGLLEPEPSGW